MSKLDDALNRALAGKASGETPAAQPVTATDFVPLLAEAMRAAAAEALANAPKPSVIVQPVPRTAWRFKVIRRDGLIEEIIATPEVAP